MLLVGVVFASVVVVLAAAAPCASAGKSMGGLIGGLTSSTGSAGSFSNPRNVGVYEGVDGNAATDKIFVIEEGGRVQRLDVNGNFERMWGRDVAASGPDDTGDGFEVCTVAADCKEALEGALAGEFDQPTGIAVDQVNGWVYVFDRSNFRIQKFDIDGGFIATFGKAVNQATGGDLCTQASGDICQQATPGAGAGQLGSSAVRPKVEVSPATGDVFVADSVNRRILQYDSSGGFVRGWGYGVDTGAGQFEACTAASTCQVGNAAGLATGRFANNNPLNLAVDSQNVVYATDTSSGTVANRIVRFDADLAPGSPGDASAALLDPINPTTGGGPLLAGLTTSGVPNGIAIDADSDGPGPDEEALLAVRDPSTPTTANTIVQQLDIPTEAGELPADPVTVVDTHTFGPQVLNGGIGVNGRTGNIYLPIALTSGQFPACAVGPGSNPSCQGLVVLVDPAPRTAVVETPFPVGSDTATLHGVANAGGFATSQFEVAKGGGSFTPAGLVRYVGGTLDTPVSDAVGGLDPNTVYRVRLVVSTYTSLTTVSKVASSELIFFTGEAPPAVDTLPVGPRSDTTAEVRGTVDPNGSAATYWFQYGPDTNYGANIPISPASVGSGNTPLAVAQQVMNLTPDTTYHYRVVADNGVDGGPVFGADRAFTTHPTPTPVEPPADRAYELVSPAIKTTGPGVGGHGGNSGLDGDANVFSSLPSVDGDRMVTGTVSGPVLEPGASVYVHDYALAERGTEGWSSKSAFNRPNYGSPQNAFLDLITASDDLSLMGWLPTGGQAYLFPETATWAAQPNYLRDWSGNWELLAPTSAAQTGSGTTAVVASGGGTHAVLSASVRGVQDSGDPDVEDPSIDQVAGSATTYVHDSSNGLTDTFPGGGLRKLVGVCTGAGATRTILPGRLATGKQEGQPCPDAAPDRLAALTSSRGASIRGGGSSTKNVLSSDGSRIFFMTPDPGATGALNPCTGVGQTTECPPQLFVRSTEGNGEPIVRWLSRAVVPDQDASLVGNTVYEGASADGDKVFFRTTSPLTPDDRNGGGAPPAGGVTTGNANASSWDLYVYDMPDAPGSDPAAGELTRVSAGPLGSADPQVSPGGQRPTVRFVSRDGKRVYFTTAAPIPGVPAPTNGTTTSASGSPITTDRVNLYLYDSTRPSTDRWEFVAQLPTGGPLSGCAATGVLPGQPRGTLGPAASPWTYTVAGDRNCVRGTDDGQFITFWTDGKLTADDPDAVSGDMYGFDTDRDELSRISAPQGGTGGTYLCETAGDSRCFGDPGFGFNPQLNESQLGVATAPAEQGDKIAYFQSRSRLVGEDTDGHMDVYEWRNGELSLVSVGVQDTSAYYSGNDRTGRDVFFITDAKLSWQDVDGVRDIYDARAGGGIPKPAEPVVCAVLAGGCHVGEASSLPVQTKTMSSSGSPQGENVSPGARTSLAISGLSKKARRRAARTGVLPVRVTTSRAGLLRVLARAKIDQRTRQVAGRKVRTRKAGAVTVKLRLSRAAKRRLRSGRTLRVTVRVASPGARKRTATVRLERGRRS